MMTSGLSIACWNVAGLTQLKRKLPDVAALISSHDVLVLTETWLTPNDLPQFPGYASFSCPTPSRGRRMKTGGVLILVRDRPNLKAVKIDASFSVPCCCIRLTSPSLPLSGSVVLAGVYIPHASSPLRNDLDDPFAVLANELSAFVADTPLIVAGDLNAHLGTLPDIFLPSDLGRGGEELLGDAAPAFDPAAYAHIPHNRANAGSAAHDPHGKQCISALCQGLGLVVLNGRVVGDTHGTCTRPSDPGCYPGAPQVLDFFLASPSLYTHVTGLTVRTDLPVLSAHSDHWPLTLTVGAPHPTCKLHRKRPHKPAFRPERWADYARSVCRPDILAQVCTLQNNLATRAIDSSTFMSTLATLLGGCMNDAFPPSSPNEPPSWFTPRCAELRDTFRFHLEAYHGAQHAGATGLALELLRDTYKHARRAYNRELRRAHTAANIQAMERMTDSFFRSPRKFWKLVSQATKPAHPPPSLTLDVAHPYFKALLNPADAPPVDAPPPLSTCDAMEKLQEARAHGHTGLFHPNADDQTPPLPPAALQNAATLAGLNNAMSFTATETAAALAAMCNGKACGADRLPAECYKYARHPPSPSPVAPLALRADAPPFTPGAPRHPPTPLRPTATPFIPGATHHPLPPPPLPGPSTDNVLADAIAALYNHILQTGDYPSDWQLALLTPVYKGKGDPKLPSNYRGGIAVNNSLAK